MSRTSRAERLRRGFSLIEALVSVLILVIVMAATVGLLFGMRAFAERQQSYTTPRQTARGAVEYLAHYLEGAGDLFEARNNPNALVMYYKSGTKASDPDVPASYNNVADAKLADLGTDIITVAVPARPIIAPILDWPGDQHAANMHVNYSAGCNDPNHVADRDAWNMYLFQQATGATPLKYPVDNQAMSGILVLTDDTSGRWTYFMITQYLQSDCSAIDGSYIHIAANPGQSGMINPPGGHPELQNPRIMAGVEFKSFRVKGNVLQQKDGIFDANVDSDDKKTGFFPIAENVEDFQVSYVYGSGAHVGEIWNTSFVDPKSNKWATRSLADQGVANGIPSQAGPVDAPTDWDVTRVIGLRFSLTARSLPLALSSIKLTALQAKSDDPSVARHYRPASEDHAEGPLDYDPADPLAKKSKPVVYDHTRLTTTVMLRNRMLGN